MTLVKNCDTRNRLFAGRNKSQHTFRSVGQTDAASSSGIETEGARSKSLSFAEDFMLEHSHSVLIAVMGSAGSFGAAPREPQKSTQSFGFPS
jgi:hypothetical protein